MVVALVVIAAVFAAIAVGALVAMMRARRHLAEAQELARAQLAAETEARELASAQLAAETEARELATVEANEAAAELQRVRRLVDGFDPEVLWSLELRRSERTWRLSVAPSPEVPSELAEAQPSLVAALQIEVEAVREEVGTIVSLDAVIEGDLTPPATVLTLRVVQELMATVVRRAEEATVHVRLVGEDMVIVVEATDENAEAVPLEPLGLRVSAGVEQTENGAIVRGVR